MVDVRQSRHGGSPTTNTNVCNIQCAECYHQCKNRRARLNDHLPFTIDIRYPYSHTLEKRSSDPPNPPAGLVELFVVAVCPDETGAALVQPPKSSSAATVGVGFGAALGAPQPPPISLAVNVSGTFIMEDVADGTRAAGAGSGAVSGVLHALPPQGSMLADMMPAAAAVAGGTSGLEGAEG